MTVIIMPWRAGDPDRERALSHIQRRYRAAEPDWPIVLGQCDPDRPFNRAAAIVDGARAAAELHGDLADVLLIADADSWADPAEAVYRVGLSLELDDDGKRVHPDAPLWAVPHLMIRRLSAKASAQVLAGAPLSHDLPLDDSAGPLSRDARPYKGNETGTLVVIRRDVLEDVPPDVRFEGWGHEDEAWCAALQTLVEAEWRGRADLYHLWHEPQARETRGRGSMPSVRLLAEYHRAVGNRAAMRELVEAGRAPG